MATVTVSACAAAVGQRFEPVAVAMLPELYKVLVSAIVVMAEAGDACMHRIVHHVHSVRLARTIIDTLNTDRSSKLRQCCASYLHQMLLEWPPTAYERIMDVVSRGVKSAITDAAPGAGLSCCGVLEYHWSGDNLVVVLGGVLD